MVAVGLRLLAPRYPRRSESGCDIASATWSRQAFAMSRPRSRSSARLRRAREQHGCFKSSPYLLPILTNTQCVKEYKTTLIPTAYPLGENS
jgi:hypothetical protein